MKLFKIVLNAWNTFWFKPIDLLPAAVFRIVFSAIIFVMYAFRQINVKEYFTDKSTVPYSGAFELLPEIFRPPFIWFPQSDFAVVSLHAVFLVLIALIGVGFYSRIMSVFALILQVIFLYRNYSVAYGADVMNCYWLFYLCFIDSDRVLSVRQKFRLPSFSLKLPDFSLSTVGVRLIQLQLCIIYGYTGLEKLKGGVWWDGSAIWQVMANQQLTTMDFSFLQNFPLLVVFMTYATLIFEIYFPVVVWIKKVRPWWLAIGVFFHIGIAISLGLVFFSGVMIAPYILFISAQTLERRLNLPRSRG